MTGPVATHTVRSNSPWSAMKSHILTFLGANSVSGFLSIHGCNLVVEASALEWKFLAIMRLFCPKSFAIGQVEAQQYYFEYWIKLRTFLTYYSMQFAWSYNQMLILCIQNIAWYSLYILNIKILISLVSLLGKCILIQIKNKCTFDFVRNFTSTCPV